jgi:hypothetical protein
MSRASLLVLLAALLSVAAARPAAGQASSFEIRQSPLLDLHMFIRQRASEDGRQDAEPPAITQAVAAARSVEAALGNPLYWGLIEPILAQARSAADLPAVLERLTPQQRMADGSVLSLREPAIAYARALAAAEPVFLETTWPGRREAIERGQKRLSDLFSGREAACVAHLIDSLGMQDPGVAVPVYLVASAPPPQGFTHRARGGAICIVGVEEADDSLLAEMLVHELIHALDLATAGKASALNGLRARLAEAGLGPTDRASRDVPHTLMFVQAAATVRALLDPEHEAYGDARGYYARVPDAARAVRAAWEQRLAGEATPEEAVDRIAAAAAPGDRGPGQ